LVKNKVDLLPGVDLRGAGGYVVAPGSSHQFGQRYLWKHKKTPEKIPLPAMPDWLLRFIRRPTQSPLETTWRIPEGQRNSTLASLLGSMHFAKADDDFKRDAAAKLEAFIASKSSAENTSTTSTTWVN
jgi:hypothetical protein